MKSLKISNSAGPVSRPIIFKTAAFLALTILCLTPGFGVEGEKANPAIADQSAKAAVSPVIDGRSRAPKTGVKLEIFFESMDGAGWQLFFLGDAVRRRLPSVDLSVIPLFARNDKGAWE